MLAQPPEESPLLGGLAAGGVGGRVGGTCEDEESAACTFCSDAAAVSSSIGVSCELPRTEEELDSGGTDTEAQLGAGLQSAEVQWGACLFLRSVSIQLELCLEAKEASAREESLMFFPEVISSPNPSWWAKA